MITIRTPFRISFFGGSTDYESFYKENGSFIIGTTIDKYAYLIMRSRPNTLSKEHLIMYSKIEHAKSIDEISNPLIRETLRYRDLKELIEFLSLSDVPARTGLGGSSSYCVGLLYLIDQHYQRTTDKKRLVRDAIVVERNILREAGGIQDHIWPVYGGLNSIEIYKDGNFSVKPLPITEDFYREIEDSVVLIYTNEQRSQEEIARSHDDKDKRRILAIAKEAYGCFLKEDIQGVGELMYESWKEKRGLSPIISNAKVDQTISTVMKTGAYGAKLLGTGGCGFVLALCNSQTRNKLIETFGNDILPVKFDSKGVSRIHS
jgi:D-glycero-alpha-D-manno-heptose-7-phosphate kinase